VLVYSRIDHPRLRYALNRTFEGLADSVGLTNSREEFDSSDGLKLWYAEDQGPDDVASIHPSTILWNDEIKPLRPGIVYWNSIPFPDLDSSGRFDPVACIFFLLSRYEEYTATAWDEHGRFSGHQAWGGPDAIALPLVDHWRLCVFELLKMRQPLLRWNTPAFRTVATIDVDSAFAFRYKGVRRTAGALLLDALRGKWRQAVERARCVLTDQQDPFDTYDDIIEYCEQHRIELKTFFLLANRSKFDINVHYQNEQLHERIQDFRDAGATVGIHPGYRSHERIETLEHEIERLASILGKKVMHSRQHFLKFRLPESYQRLIACGIQHDHSMGYADVPGFRAGTCRAFLWFDVQRNQETTLIIHPVIVMDSTLNTYMKLTSEQSMSIIDKLKLEVQNVGGDFTSLWHNETLAERGIWKGWSAVWKHALH